MERDFVRWLTQRLRHHDLQPAERLPDERLLIGPGDDAAVLRLPPGKDLVATTDMLMDGVDFDLANHMAERIGRKSLAVNLSDLAAMGARPLGALVSLALPVSGGASLGQAIFEGLLPLAREFDCPIAGGDTNAWNDKLVISITALGEVPSGRAWKRSGARPGDAIIVTGEFGGSILGRHFDFTPRLQEAAWLAEHIDVHAAIDVSDGLSLDLWRLCEASDCGALLNLPNIPIAAAAQELARQKQARQEPDGRSPLDHALSDGEDFELILTMSQAEAAKLLAAQPLGTRWTQIGTMVAEPGLFSSDSPGTQKPLAPRGYEHRLT